MTVSRPLFIFVGVLLGLGVASAASAQQGKGMGQGPPMYDSKTETTLKGTVEAVEDVVSPGCPTCSGVHLTMKAEAETIEERNLRSAIHRYRVTATTLRRAEDQR